VLLFLLAGWKQLKKNEQCLLIDKYKNCWLKKKYFLPVYKNSWIKWKMAGSITAHRQSTTANCRQCTHIHTTAEVAGQWAVYMELAWGIKLHLACCNSDFWNHEYSERRSVHYEVSSTRKHNMQTYLHMKHNMHTHLHTPHKFHPSLLLN
jgi:hypothetical protein